MKERGLRSSFDAPNQDQEAPKQAKANAAVVLTGPAPFRNDLRLIRRNLVDADERTSMFAE